MNDTLDSEVQERIDFLFSYYEENEKLKDLFVKSASIIFDIREQMRGHDGMAECPFCMGELF